MADVKAKRPLPTHPKTLDMVIEAVQELNSRNGASVQGIKRWILSTYPTVDPIRIKPLLKQALAKGLESGLLIRPKNSMGLVGATGRFKIGKIPKPSKKKPLKKDKVKKKVKESANDDSGAGDVETTKKSKKVKDPKSPKSKKKPSTKSPKAKSKRKDVATEAEKKKTKVVSTKTTKTTTKKDTKPKAKVNLNVKGRRGREFFYFTT
uniref:Protein B4-like n=1 Tax=Saccoglossus kowalevskii TaxID=10224 RepID=A0ABM0GVB7_SACKO|nr:PREDICTED: protein B4-like [Saccoglossus kowalevskii]